MYLRTMKTIVRRISAVALVAVSLIQVYAQSPKREFRGAWIHTVFQEQFRRNSTEQNKQYLVRQLDSLQNMGINAVIFQVRPQSDAFYDSKIEPWSRFLTADGKAPQPYWDPLAFMTEECHRRGMELHAWLNPYRVTSSARQTLPAGHIYHRHPERFINYGGKMYFDPGIPENREYIASIVEDIVSRYDIDAIHFDDYFYPYPVAGKEFPDDKSFARYGKGMKRDDWRRHNVDLLIEDLGKRIKNIKPWVRFGISPFGIWRNKKSDPRGSDTSGLENYDALYADVILWEKEGWIDYLLPQLYWELDHKSASYRTLIDWWNRNSGQNRHLYIGQDVERSVKKDELSIKTELARNAGNVSGQCWWPSARLTSDYGGAATKLSQDIQAVPALVPVSTWLSDGMLPDEVEGLSIAKDKTISWNKPEPKGKISDPVRFVVYRFDTIEDIDIDSPEAIVSLTGENRYHAPRAGVYVVTALDRINNESEPSAPVIIR